jgi:hypothetical protein
MCKRGKIGRHAFISRLTVAALLVTFVVSIITTTITIASLYADDMPYGDRLNTLVLRTKKSRVVKRRQRREGSTVAVTRLDPKLTPPFIVQVIDPGNDGIIQFPPGGVLVALPGGWEDLQDMDGDNRTAANPFINGFDLRTATVSFNSLSEVAVKIRLAQTDVNGLAPEQVGSTSVDPCFNAFSNNVLVFNADPPVDTDYFGHNHAGPFPCAFAGTALDTSIQGDTDPDTDTNEPANTSAPFILPNDAPHTATSTDEFYDFFLEQPPGSVVLNVRVTGRGGLDTDKQFADLAFGDTIIAIELETSLDENWDYTNETELNFVIKNIPNGVGDPNNDNIFFDPRDAFRIRINANSSADGPGEDEERQDVTTTTSTTTTSTTTTTTTSTTSTTTTTTSTTTTTTTTTTTSTTTTSTTTTTTSTTTTITTTTTTSTTTTSTTTTSTSTTSTITTTTSTSTRTTRPRVPAITYPKGTIIYGVLMLGAGILFMLWRRRR